VNLLADGLASLAATMLGDPLGLASVKIEHAAGPREGLVVRSVLFLARHFPFRDGWTEVGKTKVHAFWKGLAKWVLNRSSFLLAPALLHLLLELKFLPHPVPPL
jgi:hypothetical protein